MTLREMLTAYDKGDRWIAYQSSRAVTARTPAAAKREIKSAAAAALEGRLPICVILARQIAFVLAGEPWYWETPAGGANLNWLTMREIVTLGRAVAEAAKLPMTINHG